jgi:aspartate/methionine/tyrosine aminotransferase
MFVMVNLEEILEPLGLDGAKLAEKLLYERNVAVIPGEFFGKSAKMCIRLSFPTETPQRIREGVRRIRELLETL